MVKWEERWSKSKQRIYYLNTETKESCWERPEGVEIIPYQPDESQITASHLLVKHSGSRRPSSWRQAEITRSKDEALELILAYRQRIISNEVDLQTLAKTESDCSSAKSGGSLGTFGKGQMQPSFEKAAFLLKIGELSQPNGLKYNAVKKFAALSVFRDYSDVLWFMRDNLPIKSSSLESLASSLHVSDDNKMIEKDLFYAIDTGDADKLNCLINDESIQTLVLQILLMATIPNDDDKYVLEPDPSMNHLLGNSFINLNALQLACLLGEEDIACSLLDFIQQMTAEMDSKILLLEFLHRTFGQCNTILHLAAYLGAKSLVEKLIEYGASIHARNDNDFKPAWQSDYDSELVPKSMVVKPIISREESPPVTCHKIPKEKSVRFDICSTLLDICKQGLSGEISLSAFKDTLTKCNYIEFLSPQKNMSLVHIACSYGHLEILGALLENSTCLINQQDVEGWSPAHCASAEGNCEILRLLGKFGPLVGPSLWDYYSDAPLDIALMTFDGETIQDVCLPDKRDEITRILHDIKSLQDCKSFNPENNILHALPNEPSSIISKVSQRIIGPIKEALFLSKDFSSASKNDDYIQSSEFNITASSEQSNMIQIETTHTLTQDRLNNTLDMQAQSLSKFKTQVSCAGSNCTLDNEIANSWPEKLDSFQPSIIIPQIVPCEWDQLQNLPKKPLHTRYNGYKLSRSLGTLSEGSNNLNIQKIISFPKSDETIFEKMDISTLCEPEFKSNNPFLDLIVGKNEELNDTTLNRKYLRSINSYTSDGPDISSGGSIKERLMRLKNLGVY